jgi:hypothetical protein
MAVQVWIGEKPEHPNERRAIVALANGLERLEGLYLLLTNFNVGGRTIDLAIIKQDAIFIIELKHCDGKVIGSVNGPWFLENANDERKRLNPGRSNPYNQVISYYYSLTNFLNERREHFLSEHKAQTMNFRSCRRLIVIAPTIQEGSQIKLDWKVDVKGLDELPSFLVTERSPEIELSQDEMLRIPSLLGCTRWKDVNELIAGVFPQWSETPPPPAQEPQAQNDPSPHQPVPLLQRTKAGLHTFAGRLALVMSVVALALLIALMVRPTVQVSSPPPAESPISLIHATSSAAGGILGGGQQDENDTCIWTEFQPVGKQWDETSQSWISVGVDGIAPILLPDVVVTLEKVNYCDDQIVLTWSVRNNSSKEVLFPIEQDNIAIRDPLGNEYTIDPRKSDPRVVRVAPGSQKHGTAVVPEPVVQNAPSLLVLLKDKPFGEASWLVSL